MTKNNQKTKTKTQMSKTLKNESQDVSTLRPMTHAPETGAENWRQKNRVDLWRRFLERVSWA